MKAIEKRFEEMLSGVAKKPGWGRGLPNKLIRVLANCGLEEVTIEDFDLEGKVKYCTLVQAIHRLEKRGYLERVGRGRWKIM